MAWEDGLEQQIVPTEDKTLFKEAIKCLNAECFRAGYIVAWLSIAESLKLKISELAPNEKQAEQSWKKIEAEEAQHKSVDKTIIAEAKNCKIIDDNEEQRILFLWAERCKFAHPYHVAPTADELRYIIAQAVILTLSKPVLYRKSFVDEFVESISTKPHYFPDNGSAIATEVSRIIPRISPDLHPYLLKSLMAKLGEIAADPARSAYRLRFRVTIKELLLLHKTELDDKKWGLEGIALKYPKTFVWILHKDLWAHLPARVKDVMVQFLISLEHNEEEENGRYFLKKMNDVGLLESHLRDRFNAYLDTKSLDYSLQFYSLDDHFYNQILSHLSDGSYVKNNSAIAALESESGVELLKTLDSDKKFELGKALLISGARGSFKAKSYIQYHSIADPDILRGMLNATFIHYDGSYVFRSEFIGVTLNRIKELRDEEITKLFQTVAENIKAVPSQRWMSADGADIIRIHSQQNEGVFSKSLSLLADALTALVKSGPKD
ncbi:MAG: hypothetical protein ACJ77K_06500 [Bacteroidia bacterium]